MKILILGASGMLGSTMFRRLSESSHLDVFGTARSETVFQHFPPQSADRLIVGVDVENQDALLRLFSELRPDVVVNCIGLVKQLADASEPLLSIPINTLLPHRLAFLCSAISARLVHFSTDCVFSGCQGFYKETDKPDAEDLYGRSKLLGEINYPQAITLRTSIVGHELQGSRSLVNWFLKQDAAIRGFRQAIFSGLPAVELADIVRDIILPRPTLHGLYHVAAQPIDKFTFLVLLANIYGKTIEVIPDDRLVIDRSLNAERFESATGYIAPEWPELISRMFSFQQSSFK